MSLREWAAHDILQQRYMMAAVIERLEREEREQKKQQRKAR
jgi:heme exporter protein D